MATKTKTQLLEEIETKNKEIQDLKNEVKKLERFKQYEEAADELAAMRDSFVKSGFTKAEAFELLRSMIQTQMPALQVKQQPVSYRSYR